MFVWVERLVGVIGGLFIVFCFVILFTSKIECVQEYSAAKQFIKLSNGNFIEDSTTPVFKCVGTNALRFASAEFYSNKNEFFDVFSMLPFLLFLLFIPFSILVTLFITENINAGRK